MVRGPLVGICAVLLAVGVAGCGGTGSAADPTTTIRQLRQFRVVVPEGFTMFDIAQAVQDAGLGKREEFLMLAKSDVTLISDLDPQAQSLEGYLFPDTYQFTRAQSLSEVVREMVKRFRQQAAAIERPPLQQ